MKKNYKSPIILFVLLLTLVLNNKLYAQANIEGEWGAPIETFSIVPVAVANLPDGRLITWSSQFRDTFVETGTGQTYTQIFNPATDTTEPETVSNTNHDMFCPGINNLADGRILSAGGVTDQETSIYDPVTGTWSVAARMNIPRGYQGNVTTPEGWVFTLGGSWSGSDTPATNGGKDAEIWSPETGWKKIPNIQGEDIYTANDLALELQGLYRVDNHLWLWPASDGSLFHAGPSEEMHWMDILANNGQGEIISAGLRGDSYSMKGTTVMFDIDKILKVGGAESYGGNPYSGVRPAKNETFVIDISGGYGSTPTVTPSGLLQESRTMHNSTVLPNGEVLVTGGLDHAEVFSDTGARFNAEIYNPVSNSWRTVAGMATPRTYHSVAILMTDGRVFVGGGGLCDFAGYANCNNWTNAEIYSPPYLFDAGGALAARPTITAPDTADYNTTINVTGSTGVQEFSLIRFSAATHSTNNEQRRIPVSFSGTAGNYNVNIPDRNLLPPGYYMLFALDANGVPSVAETIQIGSAVPLPFDSSLVLDLQFEDGAGTTVFDNSIYNNDGTIRQFDNTGAEVAATEQVWGAGLYGGALEFDGYEFNSNSIIDIPYDEASLGTIRQSVTMSAWVYRSVDQLTPDGRAPNVAIVAHEYPDLFFGYHNSLYKWAFLTTTGLVECYAGYDDLDGWVHLAATYDGATARLYANGIEICNKPITGDIHLADVPSRQDAFTVSGFYEDGTLTGFLPAYYNGSNVVDELDGQLDEVKIWNRVLDPNQIRAIYQDGLDLPETTVQDCPLEGIINAEYRIGTGPWQDVVNRTIVTVEGQQVFIRAKAYGAQYFVTTTEVDGPTFDSNTDLDVDGAYQIDLNLDGSDGLGPESNDGLIDQRSQGQYALTTANGCPTVLQINVTPACGTPVPNPYQSQDVGAVGVTGVSCEDGGVITVRGSGSDIFFGTDEFHFVHRQLDGNGEIIARVNSLNNTNNFAKAGVMMRNSLDGNSNHAYMAMSPEGGIGEPAQYFQWRSAASPNSGSTTAAPLAFGSLVRIVRLGNTFTGSVSTDNGITWTEVGSQNITMGTTIYVGLATTSHNNTVITEATYQDLQFNAAAAGTPPTADITNPIAPVSGEIPFTVDFDATGSSDTNGSITDWSWDFGDGNTGSGETISHTFLTPGTYTVTLTVTDNDNEIDTATVEITVNPTADCNGTAINAEYRIPSITGGAYINANPLEDITLTAEEGERVILSIEPATNPSDGNPLEFEVEYNDGVNPPTIVKVMNASDYDVASITAAQSGTYTMRSDQGCSVDITLNVGGLDCVNDVRAEWAINGVFLPEAPDYNQVDVTVTEGDTFIIAMNPNNIPFEVVFNTVQLKDFSTQDYAFPADIALTDAGLYTINTGVGGCSTAINLIVNALDCANDVRAEWAINGTYFEAPNYNTVDVTAQAGDAFIIAMNPNNVAFEVLFEGAVVRGFDTADYILPANLTTADAGSYVINTETGGCSTGINLTVDAFDCEDEIRAEWQVNAEGYQVAPSYTTIPVSVEEGDNFLIAIEPNVAFQVLKDGIEVRGFGTADYVFPATLTAADTGLYTINTEAATGCSTAIDLTVNTFSCDVDDLRPQYTVDGKTFQAQDIGDLTITAFYGMPLTLGIFQDDIAYRVLDADNNEVKPLNLDAFTIPAMLDTNVGPYTIETAAGCTSTFTINLECGDNFYYITRNGVEYSGENFIPINEGDRIILFSDLDPSADVTFIYPDGVTVANQPTLDLLQVDATDSGIYTLSVAGGLCTYEIDIQVQCDQPPGIDMYLNFYGNQELNVEAYSLGIGSDTQLGFLGITDYTVTAPDGTVSNGEMDLGEITVADRGVYTLLPDGGCPYLFFLEVCDGEPAVPEYTINGVTTQGFGPIYLKGNVDSFQLGMVGNPNGVVVYPTGQEKYDGVSDFFNRAGCALQGTWQFRNDIGCDLGSVEVYVSLDFADYNGDITVNGTVITDTDVSLNPGDPFTLAHPNLTDYDIVDPSGNVTSGALNIASLTTADAGSYILVNNDVPQRCSVRINLIVGGCDTSGFVPEFRVNTEPLQQNLNFTTIDFGDQFYLGLDTLGAYTVTDPSGTVTNGALTIPSAATSDIGAYTLTDNSGCSIIFNLDVICNGAGNLVSEVTFFGTTYPGVSNIGVDENASVDLGIQGETNFVVVSPDGTVNAPGTFTFIASAATQGLYELRSENGGCSTTVYIGVCGTDTLVAEYSINGAPLVTGNTQIDLNEGDSFSIGVENLNPSNYSIIDPFTGSVTNGTFTIAAITTAYTGTWRLSNNLTGCVQDVAIVVTATTGNEAPIAVAAATPLNGNAALLVNFDGSGSSDDNGIVTYSWDFGDGSPIETGPNPTHTYLTGGVYTATLTVTDNNGVDNVNTDTNTVVITVNAVPVANIVADPISGDAPLLVNFTGSGSTDDTAVVSYAWDFADGSPLDTNADTSYTFNTPGSYEVELTVTDAEGLSDTETVTITVTDPVVNDAPVAVVVADPLSGDAPLLVNFTGSGSTDDTAVVSYAWDFADGSPLDTNADTSYTFNTPGSYEVELTVTDAEGLSDTETVTITVTDPVVNDAPVAVVVADPISGDAPLLVSFTGSGSTDDTAVVSYAWDFADGSPLDTNADTSYTFNTPGSYEVELTVTDAEGLSDTETVTITVTDPVVNDAPVAVVVADPISGDAPLLVNFTGSGSTDDTAVVSYAWDFADGSPLDTNADTSYTFNTPGSYEVVLTVTDAEGLSDTETVTITVTDPVVNDAPVAVVVAVPLSGDAPLLVNFTGSGSTDDTGVVSYAWDFADGSPVDTNADTSYTFNTPGSYEVELTVTDAEGLFDTETVTITVTDPVVNDAPVAVVVADPISGDAPLLVNFTGSGSTDDTAVVSYAWDFADGSPLDTNADTSYTFNTPGTYDVVLTVTDAEGLSDTETVTITVTDPVVNDAPVAVVVADPISGDAPLLVNFTGSGSTDDTGVVSYAWDFADGSPVDTNADTSYTFNTPGSYEVVLTVTDAEGLSDTETVTITVTDPVVNDAPVAVVVAVPLSGDAPLLVNFTGSGSTDDTGVVSYAWDFADGSPVDTNADTSYTFNTPGSYEVELTVTDAEGLFDTETVTITVTDPVVNDAPVAVVVADPISGDAPLLVNFTGSGSTDDTAVVSYAWDFADGSPLDTNADTSYTFNTPGSYEVELTVTDAEGLFDTETVTITVNADNCAGSITPMYVIEGVLGQGLSEIIVPVGTPLLLTTVQRNPFSITRPNGEVVEDNINIKFFELEDAGTYTFTNESGCSFDLTVQIDLNGALTADNDFGTLVLFPNPITDQNVAIDMSAFVGESMTVGLYDISGKLLQQYLVPETHEPTVIFDLPILNAGIYHVIIGLDSTGEVVLRKLLKR